jgi:hypothetical protein
MGELDNSGLLVAHFHCTHNSVHVLYVLTVLNVRYSGGVVSIERLSSNYS